MSRKTDESSRTDRSCLSARFRRIRVFWEQGPRLHQSHLACASGCSLRLFLSAGVCRLISARPASGAVRSSARRGASSLLGSSHRVRLARATCPKGGHRPFFFPPVLLARSPTTAASRRKSWNSSACCAAASMFIASIPAREAIARLFLALITRRTSGHLSLARFARLSHFFSSSFRACSRLLPTRTPTSRRLAFEGNHLPPFIPGEPSSNSVTRLSHHVSLRDHVAQKGFSLESFLRERITKFRRPASVKPITHSSHFATHFPFQLSFGRAPLSPPRVHRSGCTLIHSR